MEGFLVFAHELIWQLLTNMADFFITLGKALLGIPTSFGQYAYIFMAYFPGFNLLQKILAVILVALLLGILLLLLYKCFLMSRKHFKHKGQQVRQEDLMGEIAALNDQVADLVDEKSKILAMKVSQLGLRPDEIESSLGGSNTPATGSIAAGEESRFPKLTMVDALYENPPLRTWNEEITLPELIAGYRNFAASRLKLFYDEQTVRLFFSSMAASRLIILEGISGTGKTSLPYSVSRYFENPCGMISVQPAYRDRAELLGYFNEFTKRFNETEFLRYLYEANYKEDPSFIVLDEMNLARIEYYFAEMLSVLEMPSADEWKVDLVPIQWETDPRLLQDGKLQISDKLWFIGTANNDDSTFTITDKVYDRAMALDLNSRADVFDAPDTPPINLRCGKLDELFEEAKTKYPISERALERIEKLDAYLQTHFKLSVGNRIAKQMKDFTPVYIACGGTEADAMDYMIQRKILKKFESLNISFERNDMADFVAFLEKTFGKTGLPMCKKYIMKLQVMF
ncbi:MAG: hypothetical protein RR281_01450 [Pseudoflavonifractor sp.]